MFGVKEVKENLQNWPEGQVFVIGNLSNQPILFHFSQKGRVKMDNRRVVIFDTTLRDAEQTPGCRLGSGQKLELAHQLAKLGADVIEAGFPASSEEDFKAVQRIASEVQQPVICALARAVVRDIERAGAAVQSARQGRIHTFIGTSPFHIAMVRKTADEVLGMAVESVRLAKSLCADVEFSPMDATRSEFTFLCAVIEATIAAGATTINIPDTVGYAVPAEFGDMIRHIIATVPNIGQAVVSVHCHDDLGLAVVNSLTALKYGARQAECTINGLGERAGNAALEEVVMALRTRHDYFGLGCGVDTTQLLTTSRLVARLMRSPVPRAKAIVGANAFAHSSGIHQDGVLKDRANFEIMRPEDVGFESTAIVLTARSGRHALRDRLEALGRHLSKEDLDRTYELFLELADKKIEVRDEDLLAIAVDGLSEVPQRFVLRTFHVSSSGSGFGEATAVAALTIEVDGRLLQDAATGDGPVDAIYRVLGRITGLALVTNNYTATGVTSGQDALGEVTIEASLNGFSTVGRGNSTDLNKAAALAYLDAANRIAYFEQVQSDQQAIATP